ncbi:condensation domain-containing protein [Streptomyces sp. NBC_01231]|nr:condensation domain-containing protein [Streptomyces sp. NBC_01231]
MSYITPRTDPRRAPTTPAQRRDWRAHHARDDNAFMNISAAFVLQGVLDEGALARAVDRLVARHEALRTVFRTHQGELWQHILSADSHERPALTVKDPAAGTEDEWLSAAADQSFDLAEGPSARFTLARSGTSRHLFCVVLHHIVSDQTSLRIALRDLAELYAAELEARPVRLPELAVQFADYAHWWDRKWRAGGFSAHVDHWGKYLGDAPTTTPLPVRSSTDRHARTDALPVPQHLTDDLSGAAAHLRTTPYVVLLSAFSGALAELTGVDEHLIECGYANRLSTPLREGVGRFSNNLVMRLPAAPAAHPRDQLTSTHRAAMTAFSHARISLDAVNEAGVLERQFVPNPDTAVAFQLVDGVSDLLPLPGLTVHQQATAAATVLDLLSVLVERNDNSLTLRATYCPSVLATDWIQDLARRFMARLALLVTTAPHSGRPTAATA